MNDVNSDFSGLLKIDRFGKLVTGICWFSFFIMCLGSLVRATDSGLACPDWPLCHNQLVPTFNYQIFLEWFHRLLGGILAILVLVAFVKVLSSKLLRKTFGLQLGATVIFLAIQVVLGGLTVLELLNPTIVSLHLINAMIFFTLLFWMGRKAKGLVTSKDRISIPRYYKILLTSLTILTFLQICVGGSVSTTHAGTVCPDFPGCHGEMLPSWSFMIWLQMSHRYIAFVLLAIALIVQFLTLRVLVPKSTHMVVRALPIFIAGQILLGVINIFYQIPVWASVAHLANAFIVYSLTLVGTLDVYIYSRKSVLGRVGPDKTETVTRGLNQPALGRT